MSDLLRPEAGDAFELGASKVIIKVYPERHGVSFTMGLEIIAPRLTIPRHRLLNQDKVLFVHKGQGRIKIDAQSTVLVPGSIVCVSRGSWQDVRNTGTGELVLAWTSFPKGLEAYYAERANLGQAPSSSSLEELARRYGIEFQSAEESKEFETGARKPHGRRRGRRRAHRRKGGSRSTGTLEQNKQDADTVSTISTDAASATALPSSPRRDRTGGRRRRAHKEGKHLPGVSESSPSTSSGAKEVTSQDQTYRGRQHKEGQDRAKEVYMAGRWVSVSGQGPVVATKRPFGSRRPRSSRR